VEEMFVDAIDRKYHGAHRLDLLIFDYFCSGYSYRDIEILLGIDKSKVGRSVNRIVTLLEQGIIQAEDL